MATPVAPQQGRKVFTLQTLPACDPEDAFGDSVGKVAGFSLHAGVAAKAYERKKLERLCRYVSRPAGGLGAETAVEPDPISRCVRTL